MITEIQLTNLKGHTGAYKLTPVTVICGENRRGKTRILDGLDVGMLSRSPKLGKTNEALFRLASGQYFEVTLKTDKFGQVTRRVERKRGKNGFTYSKNESADCSFEEILRDSSLYFGLSHDARIRLVASLVKASELPGFSVPEILAGVKNIKLDENSTASEEAILRAYTALSEMPSKGATPLEWLGNAIAGVKESLKSATDTRNRMAATNAGIAQLQAADQEQVVQAGAVERRLAAARAELGALQQAAGEAAFAVNTAKQRKDRLDILNAVAKPAVDEAALTTQRDALAKRIKAGKRAAAERPASTAELWGAVTALRSQREAALKAAGEHAATVARLERVKQPEGVDETALKADLAEKVAGLQKSIAAREKTTEQVAVDLAKMQADRAARSADYRTEKLTIASLRDGIEKFMAHDKCPTCLASGTGWQATWRAAQEGYIAEHEKRLDTVTLEGTRLKNAIENVEMVLTRMRGQDASLAAFRARLDAVNATLANNAAALDAYRQAQRGFTEAQAEWRKQMALADALEAKIGAAESKHAAVAAEDAALAALETEHGGIVATLAGAQAALTAWNAAQAELAATQPADVPAAVALHKRQQGVAEAKQLEIDGLEAQNRAVQVQRAELKRQMDAVAASERADAECKVLKAARELLEEKQASLVATAFKTLLTVVNRFTSVLIPHEIIYNSEDGLGYFDGGTFVSAATLSGAEEAVLFVGLCVSLASAAQQKIVVLDECSRFDAANKAALLARLQELIAAGVIHQAVMVDVDGAAYEAAARNGDGVSIIRV